MSPEGSSKIKVFIRWQDNNVFAGEEVKCTITFKNVARPPATANVKSCAQLPRHGGPDRIRQTSPLPLPFPFPFPLSHHGQHRTKSSIGLTPPVTGRGHRSTLSHTLSSTLPSAAATAAAAAASRARAGSAPWSPTAPAPDSPSPRNGISDEQSHGHAPAPAHKRSVSILSLSSAGTVDDNQTLASSTKSLRGSRGHSRASSLQLLSRGPPLSPPPNGPLSASLHKSSPPFHASFPSAKGQPSAATTVSTTVPSTPGLAITRPSPRPDANSMADFKFPMSPGMDARAGSPRSLYDEPNGPATTLAENTRVSMPSRSKDSISIPTINERGLAPTARILSTTSIAGTPRSSGEFYSLSNHSSETLASEYVTQQPLRTNGRQAYPRRLSNLSTSAKVPEALMMGYAQVHGSFTLDGSLVNLGPFEQVKRKAVLGGQGGGVIGLETPKRESGLLRGFGWGSFTNSIGELLGGGELSSIKDMRGIAGSKSVPLLSTPQSILFVDLQLAPGDSKAYEYVFRLPKGLPPTHRGKAIKISYSLVIGTQRPGGVKEQQVRSVEVPFRVLGGVNSHGEILGHDLMSPYILLRDEARVQALGKSRQRPEAGQDGRTNARPSTLHSFLSYVDQLLECPREGSVATLISPTAGSPSRPQTLDDPVAAISTAKEAIDLAIMRSNMATTGQQSANRFEIARSGRRIGVVMLARPAFRLGETVTMAVDFSGAEIPCYAVHAALETAERVDASLALRSEASVHRVTRKVLVSASEATLYSHRIVFTPTIPVTATPEFVTSGVSLDWKIRLEFVVPAQQGRPVEEEEADDEREDHASEVASEAAGEEKRLVPQPQPQRSSTGAGLHPLLEEISRDDRGGLILVAAETLTCESFEVAVPLRVYGAVCTGLEKLDKDQATEEGLSV